MISLSNLIKSSQVLTLEELRKLTLVHHYPHAAEAENIDEPTSEIEEPDEATISIRDQIIDDAKAFAESRIQEAAEECEKLRQDAQEQIEVWWLQKRQEDELVKQEAYQTAYDEAYQEGLHAAQQEVAKKWKKDIEEAASVLKDAYQIREQIITEAEPFIVELTCTIAEKVIGKQLSLEPDMIVEMIKRTLARRREQGEITLCVAPASLSFIQAAREELNASIDSQAELIIIPDTSVKDDGCVIRSKYGSIDARIDTQLSEIKRELLLVAHQSVEERGQQHDQA